MALASVLLLGACGSERLDRDLQVLVDKVLTPSGISEEQVVVHELSSSASGTTFLVDFNPDAAWPHPVTTVRVSEDEKVTTEDHESMPVDFVPEWHAPVWGAPYEWYDLADFWDENALPDWDLGGLTRAAEPVPDDPCEPKKAKRAVTIAGGRILSSRQDERQWRRLLASRGYTVVHQTPTRNDQIVTEEEVKQALRDGIGNEPLDELVVVWAGHGTPYAGHWALGETTQNVHGEIDVSELRDILKEADAERIVVVLLSCFSGDFANTLKKAMTEAGVKEKELIVHAAAESGSLAYVERRRPWGSAWGRRLHAEVAATKSGEDIPWRDLETKQIEVQTTAGRHEQKPVMVTWEWPVIQTRQHPWHEQMTAEYEPEMKGVDAAETACYATWLDQGDEAFNPFQDYGREATLIGRGFGDEAGSVEMYRQGGASSDWVRIPHRFWSNDAIAFNLPMSRDGFPHNGVWTGLFRCGDYLVRVVSADGTASEPQRVHLTPQVYQDVWTSSLTSSTAWMEMWHPFTDEALFTNGPTLQLSHAWNATVEAPPVPQPDGDIATQWELFNYACEVSQFVATTDQDHTTSPSMGTGWNYEYGPTIRGAGAYNQESPEFRYWGFRIRFDDTATHDWGFTVLYN